MNISLPSNVVQILSDTVEPRKRSRFIAEAIMQLIRKKEEQQLAADYRDASAEIHTINQELEGVVCDGLD
jgi:metal-responsive CopG/Arc/MetJ family transcriptional regulator